MRTPETGPAARVAARPFHVAVASVAAGLALATASPLLVLAGALGAALALAACRSPALGAVAAALLLTGAALGDARIESLDAAAARIRDGPVGRLRVHLATQPRPSAFGSSAEVVAAGGRLDGTRLLLRVPRWSRLPPGLEVGRELAVSGRIQRPHETGTAGFDLAALLRRRGVAGELLLDKARATGGRRAGIAGILDTARRRAERAVAAGLPGAEAALARGMVLGQDEEIDESTRQDWRDAGLAHLLAVSGQNVMLLVALAMPLLALAGTGPYARGAALLVLVALYVPLAGAGPSLQRAGVMGIAGIAAMMMSRPASRWYALLLAAALTLALNPRASEDPGWQLSFAAVAGILSVGRPLAATLNHAGAELMGDRPRPARRALARGLADGVAITVAATLATAPLVAFHFGAVPLAGLIANLLALPAVAPATWLGMVKAALGLAGAVFPPADRVAGILGPLTRPPLAYLDGLAERCADLPGGRLELPLSSPLAVCLAYAGLGLAVTAAVRLVRGAAVGGARLRLRPASANGPPPGGALPGPSGSRLSRWSSPWSCSRARPASARPHRPATSRSGFSTSARATPPSSSIRTAPRSSSTGARPRAGSLGCCVARVSGGSRSWSPPTPRAIITAGSWTCLLAIRSAFSSTAETATRTPASRRSGTRPPAAGCERCPPSRR